MNKKNKVPIIAVVHPLETGCPCKGCQDRYVGCHSECDKYKEWRAEYDRVHATVEAKREQEKAFQQSSKNHMTRLLKIKQRGGYKWGGQNTGRGK